MALVQLAQSIFGLVGSMVMAGTELWRQRNVRSHEQLTWRATGCSTSSAAAITIRLGGR